MQSFLETPRFDPQISYGSTGGPGFLTYVFTGESGSEGVLSKWQRARARYSVVENLRNAADMASIRALFYCCRGRAVGFRFKDWGDYTLTDELIGVGDGINRVFRLIKTYGSGTASEHVRRIFKPVSGTVSVKVNGSTVSNTTYTVNTTTGTITFNLANTPAVDHTVEVTCEFDVPVRFDSDLLQAAHDEFDLQSVDRLDLIEITLED